VGRRGGEALGGALLGFSALLFGSVVLFGKFALRAHLPVLGMLAIRFAVAALLLLPLLVILRAPLLPAPGERVGIVVVGVAGYGVEAAFFFSALRHGTAAAVTLLFFTYPVFVTLASWAIGRERPRRLTALALLSAIAGAALVVATGAGLEVETIGVVLALACAVAYTGYLMGADHVLKRTGALTGAMWQAGSASAGLTLYALVRGQLHVPGGWHGWWPILGMAAATAAAFFCLLEGLQRLGPVRTAIISSSEPLAAAAFGYVFLGESVGVGVAIGGAFIVAGSVAAAVAKATPVTEPPIP
jgi:drug/metabolite transporter (DMT)-like permease